MRTALVAVIAAMVLFAPTVVTMAITGSALAQQSPDLFPASEKGDVAAMQQLLVAGADPNMRDVHGWTALLFAAAGKREAVELLLRASANPNIAASKGDTPLTGAVLGKLTRWRGQVGDWLPLLELQGRAHLLVGHIEPARAAWSRWLLIVPPNHSQQLMIAERVMQRDLNGLAPPGFRDCAECPEMIAIPAGSFMMGSPAAEPGRLSDEGPQRQVVIARPLAIGKYEVTFAEWDACVASGGCNGYRPDDLGWGRDHRPVINVSWQDAQSYVQWLSRRSGHRYRLLSEAEWEYAARAGTTTARYWGDAIGDGHAVCGECGSQWDKKLTAPVGSFRPNPFGLHDMLGNVWEWTEDCYHDSYAGAPADGSARISGAGCRLRVLRGGTWLIDPGDLRAAFRFRNGSGVRYPFAGFRVARTE